MRSFTFVLVTLAGCVLVFAFIFYIFEQQIALGKYKKAVYGAKTEVLTLQKELESYKNKTAGLKQVLVLSTGKDTKNALVGNVIHTYANKVVGDVSMYYKNLTTNDSVIVDGDKEYYMASLYKVILTLYVLDRVKNNTLDLQSKVGTSSATLSQALEKIITESNNEYAIELADTYGWKNIEKAIEKKLAINFNFDKSLAINVKNVGVLLENIALSLRVSDDESEYLLRLLKDQTRLSKLPKYLPASIYSHNKTGEFEEYSHDAGIFYTPKANYILIFMSKTKNPGETNEQMALMSKEIYEILNK